MAHWTTADWVILVVSGFIAVTSLVRLMLGRRDALARELDEQARRTKRSAAE
jgi:hypothetical protein